MQREFSVHTQGQGLYEVTRDITTWVHSAANEIGLLTIFVRHTSCSILIQENADPEVQTDLLNYFCRLVPSTSNPTMSYLTHIYEGPDDMPAHIKAAMMPTSISIPITNGRLVLGTWQGIYLFEHRDKPHTRNIIGHISA